MFVTPAWHGMVWELMNSSSRASGIPGTYKQGVQIQLCHIAIPTLVRTRVRTRVPVHVYPGACYSELKYGIGSMLPGINAIAIICHTVLTEYLKIT